MEDQLAEDPEGVTEVGVSELQYLIKKSGVAMLGGLSLKEQERGLEVFEKIAPEIPDDRGQRCVHLEHTKGMPSSPALQGFAMCRFHIRKIFEKRG